MPLFSDPELEIIKESLKFWNLQVKKKKRKKTIEKQNRKEKYIYLTVFPQRRF